MQHVYVVLVPWLTSRFFRRVKALGTVFSGGVSTRHCVENEGEQGGSQHEELEPSDKVECRPRKAEGKSPNLTYPGSLRFDESN